MSAGKKTTVWKLNENELAKYGLQDLENIDNPRFWLEDEKLLTRLGGGSGRLVYDLEDGNVLKIARGSDGIEQNKNEVKTAKTLASTGYFPQLLAHDPKYKWIIMQKAKTWESEGDFYAATGLPDDFLDQFCSEAIWVEPTDKGLKTIIRKMSMQPELKEVFDSANELGKKILKMLFVLSSKYRIDDIGRFDHIGMLKNGNVVVVDSGLNLDN